jgi:hypothetical protein
LSSNPNWLLRGPKPPRFALSRPGGSDRPFTDGSARNRDDRNAKGRFPPRRNTDRDALVLREEGRSFAAIARSVGLKRATYARQAFLRELRSRPDEERQGLVEREQERLDQLEVRIRARDAAEPEKLKTRLGALEAMRTSLS